MPEMIGNNLLIYQNLQIGLRYASSYMSFERYDCKPRQKHDNSLRNLQNNKSVYSEKSQRNLKTCLEWFISQAMGFSYKHNCQMVKKSLAFITLTFPVPVVHDDKYVKKNYLNQFFIEARKLINMRNYVWRAERQQNGNIHFHILTDRFFHYSEVQEIWNRIINKDGYVDKYQAMCKEYFKDGFKIIKGFNDNCSYANALKRYSKALANNFSNPPSCQAIGVRDIKNVPAYVAKYVSKTTEDELIDGKTWYASERVIKYCKNMVITDFESRFGDIFDDIHDNYMEIKRIGMEYVRIWQVGWDCLKTKSKYYKDLYGQYIEEMRIKLNAIA